MVFVFEWSKAFCFLRFVEIAWVQSLSWAGCVMDEQFTGKAVRGLCTRYLLLVVAHGLQLTSCSALFFLCKDSGTSYGKHCLLCMRSLHVSCHARVVHEVMDGFKCHGGGIVCDGLECTGWNAP